MNSPQTHHLAQLHTGACRTAAGTCSALWLAAAANEKRGMGKEGRGIGVVSCVCVCVCHNQNQEDTRRSTPCLSTLPSNKVCAVSLSIEQQHCLTCSQPSGPKPPLQDTSSWVRDLFSRTMAERADTPCCKGVRVCEEASVRVRVHQLDKS